MRYAFFFFGLFFSSICFSQHTEHKTVQQTVQKEEPRVSIDVPDIQQQKIGLRVTKAEKKIVENTIRTVGTITADQQREAHVHTKINGWIERIYADYIGKPIKKGQSLFELYSPDLVSTQEEYLQARRQGPIGKEIAKAALDRLKLWGVPKEEIEKISQSGKAKRTITFDSPVDGFIINKTAISGMYITPEMELYHIADLTRVWILVTLYEYDVTAISVGDVAQIQLPYDPAHVLTGKISYIYPEIDLETRTAKARIEMDNRDQKLKPGMFVNVELRKNLGEAIIVPEDAIIDTGIRKIVFVKSSTSRFDPRVVRTGPRIGNSFIILSGLNAGEEVVSSAHFLIDAESKLQATMQKGSSAPSGHSGHTGK